METMRSTFEAIGTHWDIQIFELLSEKKWSQLQKDIEARIADFDKAYSRFRADSLVSSIAAKAGSYKLPPDGFKMLRFYEQLYKLTNGKVTPLIGQTMADAGYDASYSFQSQRLQQPPGWENVLRYDSTHLEALQPILLDFGAAGKGYLVDLIGEVVIAAGIQSFLINAGGDILHRSAKHTTVDIGLENPLDSSEVIGTLNVLNQSLCASSGSKRKWGVYHHIIDPVTLSSPHTVLATWVLADDTMTADGLATALFFVEAPKLQQNFSFDYAVLDDKMSLEHSKDFPVKLFTPEQ